MTPAELACSNLRLAHNEAHRFAVSYGGGNHRDLYTSALLGLWQAATRYRADGGAKFSTFATRRMRGQIIDDLRSGTWGPAKSTRDLSLPRMVAMSTLEHDEELKHRHCPLDYGAEDELPNLDARDQVCGLLDKLGDSALAQRARVMVMLHCGLEWTYLECAAVYGVSESTACKVVHWALERMREAA